MYLLTHDPRALPQKQKLTGIFRLTPIKLDLTCPGISSYPSMVWRNVPSLVHDPGTILFIATSISLHVRFFSIYIYGKSSQNEKRGRNGYRWRWNRESNAMIHDAPSTSPHLHTSGSAFSLIVKLADVCMMNRFAMPMFIFDKSSLMMRFTWDVMR
jgi:hypothetical protein